MRRIAPLLVPLALLVSTACTTYPYALNVKLIAFDDSLKAGPSVGQIRGEDCTWDIVGHNLGVPGIEPAMADLRDQRGSKITDAFGKSGSDGQTKMIRYVKNVSSGTDGFDAVVVAKHCVVLKGSGYR